MLFIFLCFLCWVTRFFFFLQGSSSYAGASLMLGNNSTVRYTPALIFRNLKKAFETSAFMSLYH